MRVHIVTTTLAVIFGMAVLDVYLILQNNGSGRTGIIVMLLIGDLCLLLILR